MSRLSAQCLAGKISFYVVMAKQHKPFKRREFIQFLVEKPNYNEPDEVKIIAVR